MNNALSCQRADEQLKSVLVVGVGNRLLGDEGVGPHIIDNLLQTQIPSYVDVIDCGCDLLSLASYPHKPQKIIVIDAIRAGGRAGEIYKFDYEQLDTSGIEMCSAHQICVIESLRLLKKVYANINSCKIIVIGIEPKEIKIGNGLSKKVKESIGGVTKLVLDELTY